MKILAIFTCFNRVTKTVNSIKKLVDGNKNLEFEFIVVDDGSKDGTIEALEQLRETISIYILQGSGSLYYSGGMRMGMEYALNNLKRDYDYLLMMNDDVEFFDGCICDLIAQSQEKQAVIVGTTCSHIGKLSYGAIKYKSSYKYVTLDIEQSNTPADAFNANCVLIPYDCFLECGPIDPYYIHSLGDFDYGLIIRKKNYKIYPSKKYCGYCDRNDIKGTWLDISLSVRERLALKEKCKGQPRKQWFYFLKKNFGLIVAVRGTITSYLRIILGR